MLEFRDQLPDDATEEEKLHHAKREEAYKKYCDLSKEADETLNLQSLEIETNNLLKFPDDENARDQANADDKLKVEKRLTNKTWRAFQEYAKIQSVLDQRKQTEKQAKIDTEAKRLAAIEVERQAFREIVQNYRSELLNQFAANVRLIAETVSESKRHDGDKRPGVVLHPTVKKTTDDGIAYEQVFEIRPVNWNRTQGFDTSLFSVGVDVNFKLDMKIQSDGEVLLSVVKANSRTARQNFANFLLLVEQNAHMENFIGVAGNKCLACGRLLLTEESQGRSVGPECWKNIGERLLIIRKSAN
jgi:hypothetical protein